MVLPSVTITEEKVVETLLSEATVEELLEEDATTASKRENFHARIANIDSILLAIDSLSSA